MFRRNSLILKVMAVSWMVVLTGCSNSVNVSAAASGALASIFASLSSSLVAGFVNGVFPPP